jgi:hypothetical protein
MYRISGHGSIRKILNIFGTFSDQCNSPHSQFRRPNCGTRIDTEPESSYSPSTGARRVALRHTNFDLCEYGREYVCIYEKIIYLTANFTR